MDYSQFNMAARMEGLPKQFFASLTGRVAQRVSEGHDVINLGQGNPDLPTPSHIVEALREAVLDPVTHRYGPFSGLFELKQAAAEFYHREYDVEVDPAREVAILFGGKAGLVELSEIYLNPGDVALVPDPGYPDYWSGIALAGGRMDTFPLLPENRFLPDLSTIDRAVLDEAKLLFLNYPNNPTGAVANSEFFEEAAALARRHDILVVHDFAYSAIGYGGVKPPSFLQTRGAKDIGVEICTLSKTYNMAGWRIGFAVGQASVIEAINLYQDHMYVSLFPAVQRAAIVALTGPQDSVRTLVATYESRRDAFIGRLNEYGLGYEPPGGSFFSWLPLPQGFSSQSYADFLLESADVAVAAGIGFGTHGEGFVRVGLLAPEARLIEAADRIGRALARRL